ncbi:prenyltransferase/squalene oxidase repeat-containing protein [Longispora sp. NPDC051575]|uniref:prenyltransferase/squalene oxidase repeat-containing protein n=1 Tax=Longispora sp. NPDC051575 TaxID=3154943 RepID=UPI0034451654
MPNVDTLLASMMTDGSRVSTSVYDTSRLVSLVPQLAGHQARVDFLLRHQAPDGSWGGVDGYGYVPTLSATESLLAAGQRVAAERGLARLRSWLKVELTPADTIAVELVVPALTAQVNARLPASERLGLPRGYDEKPLLRLRDRVDQGHRVPVKLWASIEVLGTAARRSGAEPSGGAVAGSPAATAAWLGERGDPDGASARYLHAIQDASGGPVPGVTPITFFERAWVLNSLALVSVPYRVPEEILDSLDIALGEYGAPAAPGLPADADDTAAVLHALAVHGRVRRPDVLLDYRTDGYFTCFPDERNPSTSTNAHILEALGVYLAARPGEESRFGGPRAMVVDWLLDTQNADGSWLDKWHASPYYATACCALALAAHGGPTATASVAAAARWVAGNQRADGSWGRWTGTVEETSYAVQVLLRAGDPAHAPAVARGRAFLVDHDDPDAYPALWHAKDLYAPVTVIRAARLAALTMAGA